MRRDKRGLLGSFIALFFATVAIVIILAAFIILSGVLTAVRPGDLIIEQEEKIGLRDVSIYSSEYKSLTLAMKGILRGQEVSLALEQAHYSGWRKNYEK